MRFGKSETLTSLTQGSIIAIAFWTTWFLLEGVLSGGSSLVVSLVPVVGTLVGTWLGGHLTRGNAERQWLKEQRVGAYLDLLRENLQLNDCASAIYYDPNVDGSSTKDDLIEKLMGQQTLLLEARNKVRLLGANRAQEPLEALVEHTLELGHLVIPPSKLTKEQWTKAAVTEYSPLLHAFRNACRLDLEKVES